MEIGTVRSNSKMTEQVPEVNKYGIVQFEDIMPDAKSTSDNHIPLSIFEL